MLGYKHRQKKKIIYFDKILNEIVNNPQEVSKGLQNVQVKQGIKVKKVCVLKLKNKELYNILVTISF